MNKKEKGGGLRWQLISLKSEKTEKKEEINLKTENHFSNWVSFIQKFGNQFKCDKNTKKRKSVLKMKNRFSIRFSFTYSKKRKSINKFILWFWIYLRGDFWFSIVLGFWIYLFGGGGILGFWIYLRGGFGFSIVLWFWIYLSWAK